jgi:putative tryptophan/tyrosine transport system substrate-binding protein
LGRGAIQCIRRPDGRGNTDRSIANGLTKLFLAKSVMPCGKNMVGHRASRDHGIPSSDRPHNHGVVVASLARPGGNVTGLSLQQTDTVGKRIELLRDLVPRLGQLAIIVDVGNPRAVSEMGEVQAAAHQLGIEVAPLEIRRMEDIAPAFDRLKADALYVVTTALIDPNRTRIITLALGARLPTTFNNREFVQARGLMSYGPNFPDLLRRTADLVNKILRGMKPGDIPVEQPTKFDLVVNLTTAKALGLTIPQTLLATADEVIE